MNDRSATPYKHVRARVLQSALEKVVSLDSPPCNATAAHLYIAMCNSVKDRFELRGLWNRWHIVDAMASHAMTGLV